MSPPRAAVFCHNGLGDGVNGLVLSQNLWLNGWKVDTYQDVLASMQNWFPHLPVFPYPPLDQLDHVLCSYDWFFVVQNEGNSFVTQLIREGKQRFPERLKVIYLYPSPHIVEEPYYSDCWTDPAMSVAENLRGICAKVLHLSRLTSHNGFTPLPGLLPRKNRDRVVVHPSGSRPTRNWPKEKFVRLAKHLKVQGYDVELLTGGNPEWEEMRNEGFVLPQFPTLDLLARYLFESGYLVGNDSGPSHLASALGIPTVTIFRRKAVARLWAPSFSRHISVAPGTWVPNLRGFRLRDRHWQRFVTVRSVRKAFEVLVRGN